MTVDPDGSAVATPHVFDPFRMDLRRNPYPHYRRFLQENPVHWAEDASSWVVARHEDVSFVLRDPRFRSSAPESAVTAGSVYADIAPDTDLDLSGVGREAMLFKDPPDHTRMRKLAGRAFGPRAIEDLRPRVERFVGELLSAVVPKGRLDLIEEFAYPLPITVICEMLDIPQSDRPRFKELSRDLAGVVDIPISSDVVLRGVRAASDLAGYFRDLIGHRRLHPGDDVISGLVAVQGPGGLTENELLATCVQLLFGGHETTQNLIGNGMLALLEQRDAFDRLREDPSLGQSAVEELLRYDSPGQLASRWVAEDVKLGGHVMHTGERVIALLGAANRDPEAFSDPDRLDLTRHPNRHVSFGHGIHFCLGAPLARLEGQIAIGALLKRLPNLELASDEPEWRETLALRGLRTLPVRF